MDLVTVRELYKNPEKFLDKEITVGGWIRSLRDSKAFGFIVISDGTYFETLQAVYHDTLENFAQVSKLGVGTAIIVKGTLVATPQAKQPFEIQAAEVVVEGTSAPDYPLQKKRHSFEYLRSIAHLRPRTNTFQAVFRVRSLTAYAIHKFFQERGFVYVHTPLITGSDCEGAGEMFQVTTMDLNNIPTDDKGNILITVAFEYPVIENKDNNAFITAVNEQYKKDAEAAISEAEAEFKDSAAAVLASEGKNYHPMVFTRSFEVSLNQDNLLSITQLDYANTYGAHPNTLKSSKTFNLAENKALTLSEVLGKNAADTNSYVKEKFDAYVKETVGELLEYYQQNSEKALSAVNFCLTEDALVLYYNPYDILPYAAGSPEVKVPYADTTIKLALSES